jgi:LPXTG-motif cell wall-anchored protein
LAEPSRGSAPSVLGFDGGRTTFFGPAPDYRFEGTSSAAPSVAGALALALQAAPFTSPAALSAAVDDTSRAVVNPYPDLADRDVTGAGALDSVALITSLTAGGSAGVRPAELAETGRDDSARSLAGVGALAALIGGVVLVRFRRRRNGLAGSPRQP